MRTRINNITFTPGTRSINTGIPDLTVDDVRLFINESQMKVICSSMLKSNIDSIVSGVVTYKNIFPVLASGDHITFEVDLGDNVAKQGDDPNATNTAILSAVENIDIDTSDLAKEATLGAVSDKIGQYGDTGRNPTVFGVLHEIWEQINAEDGHVLDLLHGVMNSLIAPDAIVVNNVEYKFNAAGGHVTTTDYNYTAWVSSQNNTIYLRNDDVVHVGSIAYAQPDFSAAVVGTVTSVVTATKSEILEAIDNMADGYTLNSIVNTLDEMWGNNQSQASLSSILSSILTNIADAIGSPASGQPTTLFSAIAAVGGGGGDATAANQQTIIASVKSGTSPNEKTVVGLADTINEKLGTLTSGLSVYADMAKESTLGQYGHTASNHTIFGELDAVKNAIPSISGLATSGDVTSAQSAIINAMPTIPSGLALDASVHDGNDTSVSVAKEIRSEVGTGSDTAAETGTLSAVLKWVKNKVKDIYSALTDNTNGLSAIKTAIGNIHVDTTGLATEASVKDGNDTTIGLLKGANGLSTISSTLSTISTSLGSLTNLAALNSELSAGKASLVTAINNKGGNVTTNNSLTELADEITNELQLLSDKTVFASGVVTSGINVGKLFALDLTDIAARLLFKSIDFDDATYIKDNAFTDFTVLESVLGANVTSIGQYAFLNCSSLVTATFPNVTTIGKNAFDGCSSLSSVTLKQNITEILGSAFTGCSSLTSFDFSNITTLGASAFSGSGLTGVINLPNLISVLGSAIFQSCNIIEVNAPNLVNATQSYLFRNDTNLVKAYLPLISSASTLGGSSGIFSGCTSLIDVTMGQNFTANVSITSWNPTEALKNNVATLLTAEDIQNGFTNNRLKLMYNIREHFAANLPDRTGLSSCTITFSTTMKTAINADLETKEAFTNKNYTIA